MSMWGLKQSTVLSRCWCCQSYLRPSIPSFELLKALSICARTHSEPGLVTQTQNLGYLEDGDRQISFSNLVSAFGTSGWPCLKVFLKTKKKTRKEAGDAERLPSICKSLTVNLRLYFFHALSKVTVECVAFKTWTYLIWSTTCGPPDLKFVPPSGGGGKPLNSH